MLVTRVQDGRCVVAVDIVNDRLLAHELEAFDPEQVRRLKQLHHIVQGDLALICVEVSQHLDEDVVANLVKSDAGVRFVSLIVEGSLLEHRCEVRASA